MLITKRFSCHINIYLTFEANRGRFSGRSRSGLISADVVVSGKIHSCALPAWRTPHSLLHDKHVCVAGSWILHPARGCNCVTRQINVFGDVPAAEQTELRVLWRQALNDALPCESVCCSAVEQSCDVMARDKISTAPLFKSHWLVTDGIVIKATNRWPAANRSVFDWWLFIFEPAMSSSKPKPLLDGEVEVWSTVKYWNRSYWTAACRVKSLKDCLWRAIARYSLVLFCSAARSLPKFYKSCNSSESRSNAIWQKHLNHFRRV